MPATWRGRSASPACCSRPSPGVFTAMGMLAGARRASRVPPARAAGSTRLDPLRRSRPPRGDARCGDRGARRAGLCGRGRSPSPRRSICGSRARTRRCPFRFDALRSRGAAAGFHRRLPRDLWLHADRRRRGGGAPAARRGAHRRPARLPRAEAARRRSAAHAGEPPGPFRRAAPRSTTPVVARDAVTGPRRRTGDHRGAGHHHRHPARGAGRAATPPAASSRRWRRRA